MKRIATVNTVRLIFHWLTQDSGEAVMSVFAILVLETPFFNYFLNTDYFFPHYSKDILKIGFHQTLDIKFNLMNFGNNSYITTLTLRYPEILSFKVKPNYPYTLGVWLEIHIDGA